MKQLFLIVLVVILSLLGCDTQVPPEQSEPVQSGLATAIPKADEKDIDRIIANITTESKRAVFAKENTATYKVTVDYRKPLVDIIKRRKYDYYLVDKVGYRKSLVDMIKGGKYDYYSVDKDITQAHFPFEARDAEEVEFHIVYFGSDEKTTIEVLAELDKRGLRPAILQELLAFGAFHLTFGVFSPKLPSPLRNCTLVALGSRWRRPGEYVDDIPVISGFDAGGLSLSLSRSMPKRVWPYGGFYSFVAVSK